MTVDTLLSCENGVDVSNSDWSTSLTRATDCGFSSGAESYYKSS
jgi:hypothetical protein